MFDFEGQREGLRIIVVLIMITLRCRIADPGTLDSYSPLTPPTLQ